MHTESSDAESSDARQRYSVATRLVQLVARCNAHRAVNQAYTSSLRWQVIAAYCYVYAKCLETGQVVPDCTAS